MTVSRGCEVSVSTAELRKGRSVRGSTKPKIWSSNMRPGKYLPSFAKMDWWHMTPDAMMENNMAEFDAAARSFHTVSSEPVSAANMNFASVLSCFIDHNLYHVDSIGLIISRKAPKNDVQSNSSPKHFRACKIRRSKSARVVIGTF